MPAIVTVQINHEKSLASLLVLDEAVQTHSLDCPSRVRRRALWLSNGRWASLLQCSAIQRDLVSSDPPVH